ncbi:AN1-type zinc finger domain-containing protein [Candidatus Undinarchaeota archaeon]
MNTFSYIAFVAGVGVLTYYAFVRGNKKQIATAQPMIQVNASSIPLRSGLLSQFSQPKKEYSARKSAPTKKDTPLSGICNGCGKNAPMPFRCRYCGELFCGEHRLPEDHNCQNV